MSSDRMAGEEVRLSALVAQAMTEHTDLPPRDLDSDPDRLRDILRIEIDSDNVHAEKEFLLELRSVASLTVMPEVRATDPRALMTPQLLVLDPNQMPWLDDISDGGINTTVPSRRGAFVRTPQLAPPTPFRLLIPPMMKMLRTPSNHSCSTRTLSRSNLRTGPVCARRSDGMQRSATPQTLLTSMPRSPLCLGSPGPQRT